MMMNLIRRLLTAPRFENRRMTRRAELIHVVILTHIFTVILGFIAVPFVSANPWMTLLAMSIWGFTTIFAWQFNQRGRVTAAAVTTCLPVFLLITLVMFVSVPMRGMTWYFGAVLHILIVGGARWGLIAALTAFLVMTLTALGVPAMLGLPVIYPHAQAGFLYAFLAQLVMVVTPVLLVMRQQGAALQEADEELASRREADRQLNALNAQLEARVAARTNELAAANADLEAYSYSVSHDLRAPLNAIQGFSTLLKERAAGSLDEKGNQYIERILTSGDRMRNLIDDLLSLAKVGRAQLEQREIDISAMAIEVAAGLSHTAPERQIDWRIDAGLRAAGDPGLIRVVLENLLGNAFKYTMKLERATIAMHIASRDGNTIEFLVSDNGAGFDNAYAKQLFMPFRRLHSEREFQGSGIGLATVSRILARHGGSIRGDGIVDGGARFWFTLPVTIQE